MGYSDGVEKVWHSANVMISKLGGLTTFEALACRLPIIADITTPPMPQEAGTGRLISNRGAGILLERSIDIVPTIRSLVNDRDRYQKMKVAAGDLSVPDSMEHIIREITDLLPPKETAVAA